MRIRPGNRTRISQKISWRKIAVTLSVVAVIATGTVAFYQLYQSDKAQASVSLTNFNALREKKSIVIRWITYSEVNSSYFIIERSGNGTDFTPLTRIDGAGNSNSLRKYEFRDTDPLPRKNYYRLNLVDQKGNSKLSDIVSPVATSNVKEVKITSVYPNPFEDRFTIDFTTPSDQQFTLMLLSPDGKIVHAQTVTGIKGNNSILVDPEVPLEKGTYMIPILFGDEVVGASRVNHL